MHNKQGQTGEVTKSVNFFILICQIIMLQFEPTLRRPGTTGERLFKTLYFWLGFLLLAFIAVHTMSYGLIGMVYLSGCLVCAHWGKARANRKQGIIIHSMHCGSSIFARFGLSNRFAITALEPLFLIGVGLMLVQSLTEPSLGMFMIVGGICGIVNGAIMARAEDANKRAIDDARADGAWQAEYVRQG
jgi:hypothetical protein